MERARKPLVVSPDVFCTPALQRRAREERADEERAGAEEGRFGEGREAGWRGKSTSKFGLERLERARELRTPNGSILAVRDPNTLARPASVKRVSFKDVAVASPVGAVAGGALGGRGGAGAGAGAGGPARGLNQQVGQVGRVASLVQQPSTYRQPSPGPWSQLVGDMEPERSFTNYVNPLADGEDDEREAESLEHRADAQQHTPMSQLSRAVDTATSRGVAFRMQTPEAVQVLQKIALHGKGRMNAGSLDHYLRTGPKELSPEPGMVLAGAAREEETMQAEGEARALLESSEDENVVEDGPAKTRQQRKNQQQPQLQQRKDRVVVSSPVVRGAAGGLQGEDSADLDDVLDEVPPTFQTCHGLKTSGRVMSPVRFNLLGDSPTSYDAGGNDSDNGKKEKSFSFGMGGEAVDSEATAQFLEEYCSSQSHDGESVDQPNPFGAMLGRLREDPLRLKSPVVGAIMKESASDGSLAGSPESPANCTPMNLISTSLGSSLPRVSSRGSGGAGGDASTGTGTGTHLRDATTTNTANATTAPASIDDASSLEDWMRRRGIENVSTPARWDLQKMWNALDSIRETTGAYENVLRENSQLRDELWETREAELDAREDLEDALEAVRFEQERSRDAAAKMADLAVSMHQQFAMLEDERRQLQRDLDDARKMLDASMDEGVANVMQELDGLKAELERLRVAEQAARQDAINARALIAELKMVDAEDEGEDDEASLGDVAEVVVVDGAEEAAVQSGSKDLSEDDLNDVQRKVEYFEGLRTDALDPRCGIKEPVEHAEEEEEEEADEDDGAGDDAAIANDQSDDIDAMFAGISSMSPFGASMLPECPHTGVRAPRTTPVDAEDMTTPYRIHIEAMNQFRETWGEADDEVAGARQDVAVAASLAPAEAPVDPVKTGVDAPGAATTTTVAALVAANLATCSQTPEAANADDSSDTSSDYEVEDIVVSPIDVEDLTRANLRQTVRQRIAAVKNDLATAKSRLSHAQTGFQTRRVAGERSDPSASEEGRVVDPSIDDCDADAELTTKDGDDVVVVDNHENDENDYNRENESHRSVFARRLDATSTPLSVRRAVFTPKTSMSALKSTARMSPRFSSSSSSATPLPPSYLQQHPVISRPAYRARRLGTAREPSAEEDREFRRRAAALNIHVSPYMRRSGRERRAMALN